MDNLIERLPEVERMARALAVALPRMREVPFEHWSPKLQDETRILARAAIAAFTPREQRIEEEWQPIETAPKDGTSVLLGWRGKPYLFVSRWVRFQSGPEGWHWVNNSLHYNPTHWRPLPEPPALASADAVMGEGE